VRTGSQPTPANVNSVLTCFVQSKAGSCSPPPPCRPVTSNPCSSPSSLTALPPSNGAATRKDLDCDSRHLRHSLLWLLLNSLQKEVSCQDRCSNLLHPEDKTTEVFERIAVTGGKVDKSTLLGWEVEKEVQSPPTLHGAVHLCASLALCPHLCPGTTCSASPDVLCPSELPEGPILCVKASLCQQALTPIC
jgi:hypothetical protein